MAGSWTPGASDVEQPIDRGMANRSPDMNPDEGGSPTRGANGYLENSAGERVFMWVNNVEANFGMVGSTAQSHRTRRFYPHNFAQPTLSVNTQNPNQYQYGRLAEFIRTVQLRGLSDDRQLLRLRIVAGGQDTRRELQKGRHKAIDVQGYVLDAQRGAERFVNAPDMNFQIAITQANQLLGLRDEPARRVKLKTIMQAISGKNGYSFITRDNGDKDSERETSNDDSEFDLFHSDLGGSTGETEFSLFH